MKRLPNFLIIGGMKCATSTLHEQLGAQPGIFTTRQKELYYFSDDHVYSKGLAWYSSNFIGANANDLCGESSTHYAKLPTYPHTVSRIKRQLGNCRFIYMMRDPIDRLISQYIHQWTEREISGTLEQCLVRHDALISYSEYARQLEPYFQAFGKASVLPVFVNRIGIDPQLELDRICRFIGYEGQPVWIRNLGLENTSASRMLNSPTRDLVINLPIIKQFRKKFIPQRYRDSAKRFWQLRERPTISPDLMASLVERLDADISKLGDWLGIELSCENFREATAKPVASPEWCTRDPFVTGIQTCQAENQTGV